MYTLHMPITPINPAQLEVLGKLILLKIKEGDLSIGLTDVDNQTFSILSFDEYSRHDANLHLYCSIATDFLMIVEKENEEGELLEETFALSGSDLSVIPHGLKRIMEIAVSTGETQVFNPSQLG